MSDMKYLVVSDIHGISKYLDKFEEIIRRENPDKIILLGDLFYHGFSKEYEYSLEKQAQIYNKYKDIIVGIRGNCDTGLDEELLEFPLNQFVRIYINNKYYFFTHGHIYNMTNVPDMCDVLVYGHYHTGFIRNRDNKYFINPGSLSLPRGGTINSYLVIEDNQVLLKDLRGEIIDEKTINI